MRTKHNEQRFAVLSIIGRKRTYLVHIQTADLGNGINVYALWMIVQNLWNIVLHSHSHRRRYVELDGMDFR